MPFQSLVVFRDTVYIDLKGLNGHYCDLPLNNYFLLSAIVDQL